MGRPAALCVLCTLALATVLAGGQSSAVGNTALAAVEGGYGEERPSPETGGGDAVERHGRFVPTDEWQAVGPGQPVPAGLHVRMDMASGRSEARLMPHTSDNRPPPSDTGRLSELTERRLRDLRTAADSAPVGAEGRGVKKEASYTGHEPLRRLLARLDEADGASDEDGLLLALEDLDYAVHEADAARALVRMGGLPALHRLLNSTSERVPAAALRAVGSAAQSNPPVQSALLHRGILSDLSALWWRRGGDSHKRLGGRLLYALSAVLRGSAEAQIEFLESGGGRLLAAALDSALHNLRAAALTSDLLAELLSTPTQCAPPTNEAEERARTEHIALEALWRRALADYRLCGIVARKLLAVLEAGDIEQCDAHVRLALALRPHCDGCELYRAGGHLRSIRERWGRAGGGEDELPALLDVLLSAIDYGDECDGGRGEL